MKFLPLIMGIIAAGSAILISIFGITAVQGDTQSLVCFGAIFTSLICFSLAEKGG